MQKIYPPDVVDIPILRKLKDAIDANIVGQERARDEIIDGFAIAMAGFNPPHHPITSLLFLGPTGVGKTEIARVVGQFFYDRFKEKIQRHEEWVRKNAGNNAELQRFKMSPLVKVDCGKFAGSMSHAVIELLGSPPSYVGWGHQPILTPLQFPNGIVRVLLLDELEKAFIDSRDSGAEMAGILMSILDEARIQNNRGEEVNFAWTIVIATSNFGAKEIVAAASKHTIGFRPPSQENKNKKFTQKTVEKLNEEIYQNIKDALQDPKSSPFRPELLNRFDRIVVFRFLTMREYSLILDQKIAKLNDHLARHNGIMLRLTPQAKQWILNNGIDFEYGVRSLERFLRRKIIDSLSRILIGGDISEGDVIEIRYTGGDELEFWLDPKPTPPSDSKLALPLDQEESEKTESN